MGNDWRNIESISGLELQRDVDLARYSSIGIGGKSKFFVVLHNKMALQQLLQQLDNGVNDRAGRPSNGLFILGAGSNVVFLSPRYLGIIVKLGQGFNYIKKVAPHKIKVGAATPLAQLLAYCQENGLTGLEFCWGIPGTVGGAIAGNAGSNKKGICRAVDFVSGFDYTGTYRTVWAGEFTYSYRSCDLKNFIITEAGFKLGRQRKSNGKELEEMKQAKVGQPLSEKSCGCVFKNPQGSAAGWLIEAAGMKGIQVGDAEVSTIHSNFIINRGRASRDDFFCLIKLIRKKIKERFNINLELEVRLISG